MRGLGNDVEIVVIPITEVTKTEVVERAAFAKRDEICRVKLKGREEMYRQYVMDLYAYGGATCRTRGT